MQIYLLRQCSLLKSLLRNSNSNSNKCYIPVFYMNMNFKARKIFSKIILNFQPKVSICLIISYPNVWSIKRIFAASLHYLLHIQDEAASEHCNGVSSPLRRHKLPVQVEDGWRLRDFQAGVSWATLVITQFVNLSPSTGQKVEDIMFTPFLISGVLQI